MYTGFEEPIKEYLPIFSPCSTLSNKKLNLFFEETFKNTDKGVSISETISLLKGITLCFLDICLKSSKERFIDIFSFQSF